MRLYCEHACKSEAIDRSKTTVLVSSRINWLGVDRGASCENEMTRKWGRSSRWARKEQSDLDGSNHSEFLCSFHESRIDFSSNAGALK